MSTRVHELAKELKLTSKELMDKLKKLKVSAKNHMSVLEPESVKLVKESLKKVPTSTKTSPVSKVDRGQTQTSSIENAKKELLLQRGVVRTAQSTAAAKKHFVSPQSSSASTMRSTAPPPAQRMKPAVDHKKSHKPHGPRALFEAGPGPVMHAAPTAAPGAAE